MPRRTMVELNREQILNCLAHIRQWIGFVSTALEHYDARTNRSRIYMDGPKPPPMRVNCPPAPEPCPPECCEEEGKKGKNKEKKGKKGKKAR